MTSLDGNLEDWLNGDNICQPARGSSRIGSKRKKKEKRREKENNRRDGKPPSQSQGSDDNMVRLFARRLKPVVDLKLAIWERY